MARPRRLRVMRPAVWLWLGTFLAVLVAGAYLAWSAWGRDEPIDREVARRLVDIAKGFEAPSFHGDDLVRLSAELPRYRRVINDYVGHGMEVDARLMLTGVYIDWCYDDEALFLLRDGFKSGRLAPWGVVDLVLEAALARDVSLFAAGWKSLGEPRPVVSWTALERFARGDIKNGVILGVSDLEKLDYLPHRFTARLFVARVLAKGAPDPSLRVFAEELFDAQWKEFLLTEDWAGFLAHYSADTHKHRSTILFDDLVSMMGFAAEYHAKMGEDVKRDQWLKRLEELAGVMREKKEPRATWLDHLVRRVKNMAASR